MKTISRYIMTLALLLTAATGAWAAEPRVINSEIDFESLKVGDIIVEGFSMTGPNSVRFYFNAGRAKKGETLLNQDVSFYRMYISSVGTNAVITLSADAGDAAGTYTPIDENGQVANAWIVTSMNESGNSDFHLSGYKYVAPTDEPAEPAEPTVTINDDKTEASFDMPTDDVTVDYELVRDMSVKMTAQVGDGSDGYRIRIKKDGNDYVPVNIEDMLISVSDELDGQHDLTVKTDFTLQIQKKGEGDTWTDLSNDDKLSVGTFRYKVTGAGNYDGTIYSNEFNLFEGYELEIAAGEYATYYKDEALYVEDEDAKLYTITTVGNETATATELTVAAANTPLLVKNNAAEAKTILLIPTTTATPDDVTPYEGFKGTLEATQIAASNATQNNYAFNGKQFVWVKDAINIGANKAWLSIENANARAINIVFDETTGLKTVDSLQFTVDSWYTIDGRKLQGKPTKKGMYILNGKKVVVK